LVAEDRVQAAVAVGVGCAVLRRKALILGIREEAALADGELEGDF
jgi:hypothetical protein